MISPLIENRALAIIIFLFSLALISEPTYSDEFDQEAEYFKSTRKVVGHENYVPIVNGGITIFLALHKEQQRSRETISGEDSDNNGVRDDIQNAVLRKYSSDSYLRRRSLLMAKYFQDILTGRSGNTIGILRNISKLDSCIRSNGNSSDGTSYLKPLVLNTYQRSVLFLKKHVTQ
jgi:hypothetical protein